MKLFADLIENISFARNENAIILLLIKYFESDENGADKDEVLNLLLGKYPKKAVSSKELKTWATELTKYPAWMIERSEQEIGNFIKTIALLLKTEKVETMERTVLHWISTISTLSTASENEIKSFIKNEIGATDPNQRVLLLRLITGTFRSPISERVLVACLSHILKINPAILILRLYEGRRKKQLTFNVLGEGSDGESNKIPPQFPEILALTKLPSSLGNHENWEAFGYREGIEVQLIKDGAAIYLWTIELEIISDKFPDIIDSCAQVNGNFVIHGQLLPGDKATSLEILKNRIHKKNISTNDVKMTQVVFSVWNMKVLNVKTSRKSQDIFHYYFSELENIKSPDKINFSSLDELTTLHQKCRKLGFSGIVLKEKRIGDSYYLWKANSYSIKASIIYVELDAMENSGIKSLTFGLSHQGEFVPVAKVSSFSEVTDLKELLVFIKENTKERFGPVRTIAPSQVYELFFDSITFSKRRKSGFLLSNVTIHRKVGDDVAQVDSLASLKALT